MFSIGDRCANFPLDAPDTPAISFSSHPAPLTRVCAQVLKENTILKLD